MRTLRPVWEDQLGSQLLTYVATVGLIAVLIAGVAAAMGGRAPQIGQDLVQVVECQVRSLGNGGASCGGGAGAGTIAVTTPVVGSSQGGSWWDSVVNWWNDLPIWGQVVLGVLAVAAVVIAAVVAWKVGLVAAIGAALKSAGAWLLGGVAWLARGAAAWVTRTALPWLTGTALPFLGSQLARIGRFIGGLPGRWWANFSAKLVENLTKIAVNVGLVALLSFLDTGTVNPIELGLVAIAYALIGGVTAKGLGWFSTIVVTAASEILKKLLPLLGQDESPTAPQAPQVPPAPMPTIPPVPTIPPLQPPSTPSP